MVFMRPTRSARAHLADVIALAARVGDQPMTDRDRVQPLDHRLGLRLVAQSVKAAAHRHLVRRVVARAVRRRLREQPNSLQEECHRAVLVDARRPALVRAVLQLHQLVEPAVCRQLLLVRELARRLRGRLRRRVVPHLLDLVSDVLDAVAHGLEALLERRQLARHRAAHLVPHGAGEEEPASKRAALLWAARRTKGGARSPTRRQKVLEEEEEEEDLLLLLPLLLQGPAATPRGDAAGAAPGPARARSAEE
eukprot:3966520-Prymnesium_polylepis.1